VRERVKDKGPRGPGVKVARVKERLKDKDKVLGAGCWVKTLKD